MTEFNEKLERLILDLKKSGNGRAEYFLGLKVKVQNIASEQELSDFFVGIIKIGAIAQYGNFSPKQERLLTLLLEEANRIKNRKS